ncbi:MAG TPA: triose-phosphate isomerase, partial [Bryobacteraceae bacterium]|nr:triose-phosphate isomerase [Bryobacteraceae bacterium]
MRRPLLAGNWKMYKDAAATAAFFEKFLPLVAGVQERDIVIAPPFVDIPAAVGAARGSRVEIGGQDLYWAKEGAFTGEVSASMLIGVGAKWVIIGHSERRQYFGETDETVYQKTVAALEAGLNPIVCIGERLEERESGKTEPVLLAQLRGGLGQLGTHQIEKVTIAYEPVWAIGTGKTATPQMAQDAHHHIRSMIARQFGFSPASQIRILYG